MNETDQLAPVAVTEFPPVLAGHESPATAKRFHSFCDSIAGMAEAWIAKTANANTQRAKRSDLGSFVEFLGIRWPDDAARLLQVTVPDAQAWRDYLVKEKKAAPKTIIRRVSYISALYTFMRERAIEARLPVQIPNPVSKEFIDRKAQDPVEPTEALSKAHARKLLRLPDGDSLTAHRDRAILACFLYTGVRIGTVCRLTVADFRYSEHNPTLRIQEKGSAGSKRAIGIHSDGADIIHEYVEHAGIKGSPLFPARTGPRGDKLTRRHMTENGLYRLMLGYLRRLPGAMKGERCIYSPHSLRATTATLLLDKGIPIQNVQELLGHASVTVTQVYNKRRLTTKESASHELDI